MGAVRYKTGKLFVQLGNAVAWFRNQQMANIGLTSTQSEAIRFILRHRGEELTAADLMAHLGLSQSTVAGIIRRLESKALIVRTRDDADARKSVIRLTKEGLAVESNLQQVALQTEAILLQGMREEEQAELNRLLEIAWANMCRERGGVGKSSVSGIGGDQRKS